MKPARKHVVVDQQTANVKGYVGVTEVGPDGTVYSTSAMIQAIHVVGRRIMTIEFQDGRVFKLEVQHPTAQVQIRQLLKVRP